MQLPQSPCTSRIMSVRHHLSRALSLSLFVDVKKGYAVPVFIFARLLMFVISDAVVAASRIDVVVFILINWRKVIVFSYSYSAKCENICSPIFDWKLSMSHTFIYDEQLLLYSSRRIGSFRLLVSCLLMHIPSSFLFQVQKHSIAASHLRARFSLSISRRWFRQSICPLYLFARTFFPVLLSLSSTFCATCLFIR